VRHLLAAVAFSLLAPAVAADEVTISPSDTMQSVLGAQKGKRVTLRLRSGNEMTGIVRDASPRLVVLGAVGGREYFDAVVPVEGIDAVLIRPKP
jgi:hypothetical protein